MNIGIISGYMLEPFGERQEKVVVESSNGPVSLMVEEIDDHRVFVLNRHGDPPVLPPHKIPYRANIEALVASHVSYIVGIGAVGSLQKKIQPGHLVVPHDFFDATHDRASTFYDDQRVHVDVSEPFCPVLRQDLISALRSGDFGIVHEQGVYVTTEGPRLETPAEIRFFSTIGDIVGMTLVPEAVLAREKAICYASLCVVCNMGAGMQQGLPAKEIKAIIESKKSVIRPLLESLIQDRSSPRTCSCKNLVEGSLL